MIERVCFRGTRDVLVASIGVFLGFSLFAAPKFVVTPYVQHPATDAMSVIFFTDSACAATVTCGAQTQTVNCVEAAVIKSDKGSSRYRGRVRFERLKPLTDYRYEVTLANGSSYSNTFRTLPGKDTPVRFIGYCDCETKNGTNGSGITDEWDYNKKDGSIARGSYYVSRSVGFASNIVHMISRQPDLITVSGDLVAKGCDQKNWDEYWKENAGEYNDPAGSIPILAAIGNHDLKDGDTLDASKGGETQYQKFFTYFEFNTNGVHYEYADQTTTPQTNDTSMLFHRTDLGPVTLIFLDTNKGDNNDYRKETQHYAGRPKMRSQDFHPGSLQYNWLTNNLADAQRNSRFTFVINHHCPYSVGIHNREQGPKGYDGDYTNPGHPDGESARAVRVLTETMIRYGVDGWLCGHDEIIEHSQLSGTETRPDGTTRQHTLNVYDLGSGGDGLRGKVVEENPYEVFRAFEDEPCKWDGDTLVEGGSHYGFMEVDVTTNKLGRWMCSLTPCYDFINKINNKAATFELRRYKDRIIIDEESDEMVYQERIKGSVIPADYVEYVRPPQASDDPPVPPVPPEPEWWIEEPVYVTATRVTFASGDQTGEQYRGFLTKKGLQYAWGTNGVAATGWVTADGTPMELKKPSDDCELMVR